VNFPETAPDPRKKRKVDMAALQSEFKRRLPALDIAAARDLIDCGFLHMDELRGRSPAAIMESVRRIRPETPDDRLWSYRMLVYAAETPDPDPSLLHPHAWMDRSL
jgi:hypothetical protein